MNGSVMPTIQSTPSGVPGITANKTKEFQMELLMEKLRTKTSQYKSLIETSKAVRMAMLDKRWALDSADKAILQKCLDNLQHSIKVCSLQSLVERLECLTRQLGLKFMVGPSGVDLFISSDMFYLEILLEDSGAVKDVKIHHEGKSEQQSCEELVSCISRGDFTDFTSQLEGLTAMYQLNAEKKVKSRAFGALNALEADLATLGQLHSTKDPWAAVHKSPIGLVHNRRGGHAMKLTYFVSPYDAACCPNGVLTLESLAEGAGLSAQVMLESSATHKLQLQPLLPRQQNNGPPVYAPLSANNSTMLPARFVLKLSKPMVVCESLLILMSNAAQEGLDPGTPPVLVMPPANDFKPLLALIAQNSATADINPSKGLFVTLPDQNQCYFLTESRNMQGCLMSNVPFTHPAQVPQLVTRLRQQVLFNALISSCIRPNSKQDLESSIMVEVSALSWQHISVLLEKPGEGGMATLELELPECGSAPRVTLYCGGNSTSNNSILEERLSRVVARTLSIPLVVRSLILALSVSNNMANSRWERQGFSGAQGGPDPGGAPAPHPHPSPHQGNYMGSDGQFNSQQDDGPNLSSMMGNNPSMDTQCSISLNEDKKLSKKRKADDNEGDVWKVKKNKLMMSEVLLDSSSSQSESGDESEVEEEINQLNNSSNDEEEQGVSPSSPVGFGSDLELSGLDPAELMMGSSNENKTSGSDFENSGDGDLNDSQDMDELMSTPSKSESKKHKQKSRDHRSGNNKMSTSSLLMELTEGGGLSASVSITPVTSTSNPPATTSSSSSFSSVLGGINLDRRPGIEIIPISPSTQPTLPSSITITPISSSQAKSMDERHRSDKKTSSSGKSKSSSSDHSKEKKKKKKREDSMGPPEKLPPKQDPLTKPVSVSIKATEGSHSPLSRSSSPNSFSRKFSPSPTHGRSVSITKTNTGSPGSIKNMGKPSGSSSHHSSPRHSPVQCSPKHTFSGYSSPKNHGTSSPKHSSGSGSSGKPSMSTLKSAASGSPSSKCSSGYELSKLSSKSSSGKESSSSSSGSSSREKERKSSGLSYSNSRSNSPKLKSSSVKLKQLDISTAIGESQLSSSAGESLVSPGIDLSKSISSSQLSARNRKGSLSAVIDKLKSAQHCSESDLLSKSSSNSNNKDRVSSNPNKTTDSKNSSSSSSSKLSDNTKTQEYMVKPSSDGMKITINKTRTKDSSLSSSKSSNFSGNNSNSGSSSSSNTKQTSSSNVQPATGSGSPKTHTGLKPGVISGPASKKPQVLSQSSKNTTAPSSGGAPVSSSGSPGLSSTIKPSSNVSGTSTGSSSKLPFPKSSSSSSLSSTMSKSSSKVSTGSPKMSSSATDLSKQSRDREREREKSRTKGTSEKSIFSSSKSAERRSSPAPTRDDIDGERAFKMLSQHKEPVNFYVEGLIKTLDTSNYQIPKLSARTSSDDPNKTKNTSSDKSSGQNVTSENRPKLMDYMGRSQDSVDSKFSFPHGSSTKTSDQIAKSQPSSGGTPNKPIVSLSSSPKVQTNPIPLLTSPKLADNNDNLQPANFSLSGLKSQTDSSKETKSETKLLDASKSNPSQPSVNMKEDSNSGKVDFQKTYPSISVCIAETINQSMAKQLESKGFTPPQMKSSDERKTMNAEHAAKPSNIIGKSAPTHSQESGDVCLDFSSTSNKQIDMKNKYSNVSRPLLPSQSPSLSVHIVKSPSPHSSSPCITDDELMDEAIVGPGK